MILCDRAQTAAILGFRDLVESVRGAAIEYENGEIVSPQRMVVPMGSGGVMLSMPAAARDVAIHKLVNVQPANAARRLPTIHGIVTVCDSATGEPLCILDGPEVTGRRTAAVTLLAIDRLLPFAPRRVLLIGTGAQAVHHLRALNALYPDCSVAARGVSARKSEAFASNHRSEHANLRPDVADGGSTDFDVVIMVTTSTHPIWEEPGKAGRLVIGVGAFKPEMAEIGKRAIDDSTVYVDDPVGARHEAGDLLRASVDWRRVQSLASAIQGEPDLTRPIVFKSVGTGAWDLAAARVAVKHLRSGQAARIVSHPNP